MAHLLTMTKPLGGVHPIIMGETLYYLTSCNEGIHSLNLQGENSHESVKKPSQKDDLLINATYVGMPI
jgi:hypothetical protein